MNPVLWSILSVCLLGVLFWIWAIAPDMSKRRDTAHLARYDYAHRGLHNIHAGIPENSLSAFEYAVRGGFGIELDLQLTADLKVVVHHDKDLMRSCGVNRNVSDLTYDELQRYPIFGTQQHIPLFSDVLKKLGGAVPLLVEIKGYNEPKVICEKTWELLKVYNGPYYVQSFDPHIVRWFRKNCPDVVRGQLMEHFTSKSKDFTAVKAFIARNLLTNFYTRPHFESYNFISRNKLSLVTAKLLFSMPEVNWTIRNEEDYRRIKKHNAVCIFEGFTPATALDPAAKPAKSTVVQDA